MLERADTVLRLEENPPLVTALYGIVDLKQNRFVYACAGHLPPLLLHADGDIESIATRGVPLGLFLCDDAFTTFERALQGGDTLILYTDGLVEYGRDAVAGEAQLRDILRSLHTHSRSTLARAVHASTFGNGDSQIDDVAILSISLLPSNPASHCGLMVSS